MNNLMEEVEFKLHDTRSTLARNVLIVALGVIIVAVAYSMLQELFL